MENKLKELLNSLIEKGRKPRWEKVNKVIKTWIDEFGDGYVLFDWELNWYKQRWCNMVELVSKSSWLWQFVCKNEMIIDEHYCWDWYIHWDDNWRIEIWQNDYQYRLIESSLKDENGLEDFLLNSIKLD